MTQSPFSTVTVTPLVSKPPFVSRIAPLLSARKLQLSLLVQPSVVLPEQTRIRSWSSLFFR